MIPEYNKGTQIYAEHMARYLFASQFVKGKSVLDIASGSGYGSEFLKKNGKAKEVIGVDIDQETVAYSKKNYGKEVKFIQGDCRNIPLKDKSVDIVVSFETIEHIKEHEKFIDEIKRILKKNGTLIISTPNNEVYPKGNEFHIKELSLNEFKTALKDSFKNIEIFEQDISFSSYVSKKRDKSVEIYKKSLGIDEMMPKPTYVVAVASNNKLPLIENSSLMISSKEISDCRSYIESLKNENNEYKRIITEKDNEIIKLKKDIEEFKIIREKRIKLIKEKDDEIIKLNEKIKEKEDTLNEIYNSKAWKLITKYRKVVGKIKK
jgi:O-antigen biosynthesis protein